MDAEREAPTAQLERGIDEVQRRLDALKSPPHATLGAIVNVLEAAIAHGAGLYNEGREDLCFRLYAEASQRLIGAVSAHTTRPRVEEAIHDLMRALERAQQADTALGAWMLRHAFDKIIISQQIVAESLQWMMRLGESAFARGDYGGSMDALRTAAELGPDLWISPDRDSPALVQAAHMAMLYYGHALLLCGEEERAHETLREAIVRLPQLAALDFDLRELGPHSQAFMRRLDALERSPAPHAPFLCAYLYQFSGQRRRAAELLIAQMNLRPDDEAVQVLLAMTAEAGESTRA